MSYKAGVRTGPDPKFYFNNLRFATEEEAMEYGVDLARRWTLVIDMRVFESVEPVNAEIKDGELILK